MLTMITAMIRDETVAMMVQLGLLVAFVSIVVY
jgi:Flp pilus assembly pilin Flp